MTDSSMRDVIDGLYAGERDTGFSRAWGAIAISALAITRETWDLPDYMAPFMAVAAELEVEPAQLVQRVWVPPRVTYRHGKTIEIKGFWKQTTPEFDENKFYAVGEKAMSMQADAPTEPQLAKALGIARGAGPRYSGMTWAGNFDAFDRKISDMDKERRRRRRR